MFSSYKGNNNVKTEQMNYWQPSRMQLEERRRKMSIKDGRDYLVLIWKEPKSRRRYPVGELSQNGQFEFRYNNEFKRR